MLLVGCGNLPHYSPAPPRLDGWHTERAEHRVSLDVTRSDGTHDHRTLRGALAVERPDRFRLRALGPGGLALFDIISVGGRVRVVSAIADPRASQLGAVIESLAGDLSAAYALDPAPPGRTVEKTADAIILREPDRTVRLSQFRAVGGRAVFFRADIDNRAHGYSVVVEVASLELDVPLDSALFQE